MIACSTSLEPALPSCEPGVAVQKSAYSCRESNMRTSEPKPHSIQHVLVSFIPKFANECAAE